MAQCTHERNLASHGRTADRRGHSLLRRSRRGRSLRLHLLPLPPDAPPVLLRAEYPMSAQAWHSVEEVSDAGRLFLGPRILLAGFFVLMGRVLGMGGPRLKRARYKHGVRGLVEEVATDRLRAANSNVSTLVHNYRIGGVTYRVEHFGPVAARLVLPDRRPADHDAVSARWPGSGRARGGVSAGRAAWPVRPRARPRAPGRGPADLARRACRAHRAWRRTAPAAGAGRFHGLR